MLPGPASADLDLSLFAPDYAGARARLLAAAAEAGAAVDSHRHPLAGPQGEPLVTDLVWVGPRDATQVLVTQSGLHGVEGFAGSAAQCDFLRHCPAAALPAGVAILHIHAINPWGFAWLRRTNEEGVDLNRNFVDFAVPLPINSDYDLLADALLPRLSDDLSRDPARDFIQDLARADRHLAAWRNEHGAAAFEQAVTSGQYRHPGGLFYGGAKPSWSRQLLQNMLVQYALHEQHRQKIAVVDLHTGLGPFGHGELICDHLPDSSGVQWARRCYGESVTEPLLGTSSSGPKAGLVDFLWHRELGDRVCFVTLEFGTFPLSKMFPVLRNDHLLHGRATAAGTAMDWSAPDTQRIKTALRDHFYPAVPAWQQLVLFRARQVFLQALSGLATMNRS